MGHRKLNLTEEEYQERFPQGSLSLPTSTSSESPLTPLILTDNRSSVQHLSNWPSIDDSTSRSILHLFQQLSDQHPIHLQWFPSHVGLLGNEVSDDLAKAATSNPVDLENDMVLTSTEIYSRAKGLICRTWVVPPVHPCIFCNVWGFPVRRLLHSPAVLRLCTDLWTHGSGLVSLDQMGISPTTTTTRILTSVKPVLSGSFFKKRNTLAQFQASCSSFPLLGELNILKVVFKV
ncbi:RNase H domain-containing protein [Trichonephila clavipes]|nr:RNase H domain-containing protein [Trichonephila clavipes]